MKNDNVATQYQKKIETLHKKIAEMMVTAAKQLGDKLIEETMIRTPTDKYDLRNKWALNPVEKLGDKYIISITNPAEYGAYVEFGYMQRPGMILKMKEDKKGKLRFVKFLGYSSAYKLGDPTGKVEPDKDGFVVIITRKRFIKGHFMAREGLRATKKKYYPKLKKHLLKQMKKSWEAK